MAFSIKSRSLRNSSIRFRNGTSSITPPDEPREASLDDFPGADRIFDLHRPETLTKRGSSLTQKTLGCYQFVTIPSISSRWQTNYRQPYDFCVREGLTDVSEFPLQA